ncbi:MAG: tyrosine-type recombinase/integrase, partial [Rhodothermales bacterium]
HSRLSYYRQLRVFFRWCIEQGLCSSDPTDDVARPRPPKKNPIFFTRAEIALLTGCMEAAGDYRMVDITRFALATGGRLGEICQLQYGDVDAESEMVHFRASGGRTNKSSRDRAVPLVPMARLVYERQRERYPSPAIPRTAPLFLTMEGGPIRDKGSSTSHRFKRYVRKCELSEEYSFHTLRHTFASWLRLAGVPLDRIQYWLGHASITTTEKYAHIIPQYIRHESAHVFSENVGLLLDRQRLANQEGRAGEIQKRPSRHRKSRFEVVELSGVEPLTS